MVFGAGMVLAVLIAGLATAAADGSGDPAAIKNEDGKDVSLNFSIGGEGLGQLLVEKISGILKKKGNLLALFHNKDAGAESPYCRYHIIQPDTLELEPEPGSRILRIFNSRHVENLFKDFASRKFFLGRDNIREVMVVR